MKIQFLKFNKKTYWLRICWILVLAHNPFLWIIIRDGLQDLVIGNKSFFVPGGMRNSRVYLYENIGTASTPKFEQTADDLWGLNVFSNNSWRFTPAFGDLDGDGDLDALIGEEFGNLFYAENIAGPGNPFEFATAIFGYQDIDVGQVSKTQIIDMNRDGLLDLVIGERNGNINYFENMGTAENPAFPSTPTNNFFWKSRYPPIGKHYWLQRTYYFGNGRRVSIICWK